jgi:hypothetical protein
MSKNKIISIFLTFLFVLVFSYLFLSRLTINEVGNWEALNLLEEKLDDHAKCYGLNPALNLLFDLTNINEDSAFTLRIREKLILWLSAQKFTLNQRARFIQLTKASFDMALSDESRDEHKRVLIHLKKE